MIKRMCYIFFNYCQQNSESTFPKNKLIFLLSFSMTTKLCSE